MGTKPRSSEREAIALNPEAISPALRIPLVSCMVLLHIPTPDGLKQISGVLSFHQKMLWCVAVKNKKNKSKPHYHFIIVEYLWLIIHANF